MEKSCFRAWKRHGSRRTGSFSRGGGMTLREMGESQGEAMAGKRTER